MDTPTIAKYYREKDPMERLKLLEQSIAAGEEPEENRIRKELWEIRYSDKAETGDTRADGYLGLWMTMEFNRNSASRFFGTRSAKKEIGKYLKKLKFQEFQEKGGLYEELLYRELETIKTTLVSVGHRSTIVKFHKQILELTGNGEWQSHTAEDYDASL